MRVSSAHIILYILVIIGAYFGGYWAGNRGYLDEHVRPLFAAFKHPLLYHAAPMIVPNASYPPTFLAPQPSTVPPVPLVTLAAANEIPSTEYATI